MLKGQTQKKTRTLPSPEKSKLKSRCRAPISQAQNQKFRKGVGGQSWLARGDPSHARASDLFSVPFSYATLMRRGKHNFGVQFLPYLGPCKLPTPSRQPLFETSDRILAGILAPKKKNILPPPPPLNFQQTPSRPPRPPPPLLEDPPPSPG